MKGKNLSFRAFVFHLFVEMAASAIGFAKRSVPVRVTVAGFSGRG